MEKSPIRPTDDAARASARHLMLGAKFAALGVLDAKTGAPFVSRISFSVTPEGMPFSAISALAFHTGCLRSNPTCSLLIGEPPNKGDPLAYPRLTLSALAEFVPRDQDETLRAQILQTNAKSKLYIGFADFHFVRFKVTNAAMNNGFGKAYNLTATDLA